MFEVLAVSSESVSLSESSHRFGYLDRISLLGLGSMGRVSVLALPMLSMVNTTEVRDLGRFVEASEMDASDVVEFLLYRFNGDALL